MDLTFSAFQLIIGTSPPSLENFQIIEEEQYDTKDFTYKINAEKFDNRFFWLYARYGKALPYSNEVVDRETEETIDNPRQKNHVELNQQLFVLFDVSTQHLYISNGKKKSFLEEYLKFKLSKDITIKMFFLNPKEFIEKIKTIDRVSFTAKHNLFSENSGLFEDTKDIFGLGQPKDFRIDINYDSKSKTDKFIQFFESFLAKNTNQEIHSLVCIGKDDTNIESIFDINSYIQKRTLNLKKDSEGLYDATLVKNTLIDMITGKR